jgi:hypothetical protein
LYSDACNAPSIGTLDDNERLIVKKIDANSDFIFKILTEKTEQIPWQLLDLQGNIVQKDISDSNIFNTITIDYLPNGIYILGIKINEKWIYKKILVLK